MLSRLKCPPFIRGIRIPMLYWRMKNFFSRLVILMKGWGTKEDGLDLITCCSEENGKYQLSPEGTNLRFDFFNPGYMKSDRFSRIFFKHFPFHFRGQSIEDIMQYLTRKYKIPPSERFALFSRVRLSLAFENVKTRRWAVSSRCVPFLN